MASGAAETAPSVIRACDTGLGPPGRSCPGSGTGSGAGRRDTGCAFQTRANPVCAPHL